MGQDREPSRDPLGPVDGPADGPVDGRDDSGPDDNDARTSRVGPIGMFVFAALGAVLAIWAAFSADLVLTIGWGIIAIGWLIMAVRARRRRRETPGQVSSSRRR